MRVKLLSILGLSLFGLFLSGQEPIDLLISNFEQHTASDPDSSLLYCDLIIAHYREQNDVINEAFYYNRKGVLNKRVAQYPDAEESYRASLKLYREVDDKKGESIALNNLGEIHLLQGEYTEAIRLHQQTLSLKQELQDTFGIGSSYLNLGNVYLYQSLYEEAISNYMEASEMFLVINDSLRLSSVYNNLGALHNYMGTRDKALAYWERSLEIKKQVGNLTAISKALNNLAEMYMVQGDLDVSLKYLQESLTIKKKIKDQEGYLVTTYNLGECQRLRKEYDQALVYFAEAQTILAEMPLSLHHAELHNKLGLYYLELRQLRKAEKYFLLAQQQAQSMEAKEVQLSVVDNLALTYEMQGDYKKALESKGNYVVLRDSFQRQEQQNKILELESKYEVKSKNQQIELLQSENTIATLEQQQASKRNRYLLGGVAALSLISLILYRNVRLKRKNSKLLQEKNLLIQEDLSNKEVLINEIHHRIKNNLSIIDSLINIQLLTDQSINPEEILRNAQNRIKSISRLHDLLYQNQITQEFDLSIYLNEICSQVMDSYNGRVTNISLNCEFENIVVDESNYIKLGLITNELLTNAIKHGFTRGETGVISVALRMSSNQDAQLSIFHSGVQPTLGTLDNSKGMGVQLIKGLAKQISGAYALSEEIPRKFTVTFPCEGFA